MAAKIKKGDRVIVLAGKDKGATGDVLKVLPSEGRALVSGVNAVKRHRKARGSEAGGIITKNLPIHLSNLAIFDPAVGKAVRVGFRILDDGTKVRFSKASGAAIDG